jgi:hypothetical protein
MSLQDTSRLERDTVQSVKHLVTYRKITLPVSSWHTDRICGNVVSNQAKATVTKGTLYREYLIFLYILLDIGNRTHSYGVASCIQTVQ